MIGLSRGSWYLRHHPRARVPRPVPHRDRHQPHALTSGESAEIVRRVLEAWDEGDSVLAAYASAWDEGVMVGSPASWHRRARSLDQQLRPVPRRRGERRTRPAPSLLATGPNQVWSWDITDLPGPMRGQAFKLYSIRDIYSRATIAYRVEQRESAHHAVDLFARAIALHGAPRVVHADSGAAMTANMMQSLFREHNIFESHSRPHVSNDNPYSESEFRTMKHRPNYPGYFNSLAHARDFVDEYVDWYQHRHHHSGLALFTPEQVHTGQWRTMHDRRKVTLDAYYQAHPDRFHHPPTTPSPPNAAGINHPHPDAPALH